MTQAGAFHLTFPSCTISHALGYLLPSSKRKTTCNMSLYPTLSHTLSFFAVIGAPSKSSRDIREAGKDHGTKAREQKEGDDERTRTACPYCCHAVGGIILTFVSWDHIPCST